MLTARFYGRYSSSNQKEVSIEGQYRTCLEYATRAGYKVTGEYADRALSGKFSESRAQFLRMMRDAERGLFDVLLVYKMDRFARNRYDAAVFKYRLRKAGVKLISVMENIPSGKEGIILESVLDGYAEYFSENLAENVRRGAREAAMVGKFNGGQTPYGFRIVDGKYTIDEARAEVVREVFSRFAAGETYKKIYDSLNARGLRTLKGKPFSRGSVASMLVNEKYIGQFIYNVGEGEPVVIEGGCPAIISNMLWNAVQARRAQSTGKPRLDKGSIKYVLSGKIFCAVCGESFHGFSCSSLGKTYTYYRHNYKDGNCTCPNKQSFNREKLNKRVFEAIKTNVLNKDTIEQIAAAAAALQADDLEAGTVAYQSELAEVNTAIENIYIAIEKGIFSDGLKARLDELEARAVALSASVAEAVNTADFITADEIREYLMQFVKGNIEDDDFREQVIATFVKRIEIDDDIVRVFLHYTVAEELEDISLVFDSRGLAQVQKTKDARTSGIILFT